MPKYCLYPTDKLARFIIIDYLCRTFQEGGCYGGGAETNKGQKK